MLKIKAGFEIQYYLFNCRHNIKCTLTSQAYELTLYGGTYM